MKSAITVKWRMRAALALLPVVLLGAVTLTACGSSGNGADSVAATATSSSPSPTPLADHAYSSGEKQALARAVAELKRNLKHPAEAERSTHQEWIKDYLDVPPEIVGYFVDAYPSGAVWVGVYVDATTGLAAMEDNVTGQPGDFGPGQYHYGGYPPRPRGKGENWAVLTAARACDCWLQSLAAGMDPEHMSGIIAGYAVGWPSVGPLTVVILPDGSVLRRG